MTFSGPWPSLARRHSDRDGSTKKAIPECGTNASGQNENGCVSTHLKQRRTLIALCKLSRPSLAKSNATSGVQTVLNLYGGINPSFRQTLTFRYTVDGLISSKAAARGMSLLVRVRAAKTRRRSITASGTTSNSWDTS
jgi:hypothetical protein